MRGESGAPTRPGRTDLVQRPHLVHASRLKSCLPAEVGDVLRATRCCCSGTRARRCAASGSRNMSEPRGGEDVLDLGERNQPMNSKRRAARETTTKPVADTAASRAHARGHAGLGQRAPAGDHSVKPTRRVSPRARPPRRLSRNRSRQSPVMSTKRPVFASIATAVVVRISGLPIRARVVELGRLEPAAPYIMYRSPPVEQHAGNIDSSENQQIKRHARSGPETRPRIS